jgi:class 3 adenylate cyclase
MQHVSASFGFVLLAVGLVLVAFGGGVLAGRRGGRRRVRAGPAALDAPDRAAREVEETSAVFSLARDSARLAAQALAARAASGSGGGGRVAESLRGLVTWALEERPDLRRVMAGDGEVTLMFSDIVGSTELNERLGDAEWIDTLRRHDGVLRRRIREHGGRVVKTQGDSFMVAFASVPGALRCATAVHIDLEPVAAPDGTPVRVRIGVHSGEAIRRGGDWYGITVAMAARIAAEARGGEVLVSKEARSSAEAEPGIRFGRGRRVSLKGISERQTVYPVYHVPAAA